MHKNLEITLLPIEPKRKKGIKYMKLKVEIEENKLERAPTKKQLLQFSCSLKLMAITSSSSSSSSSLNFCFLKSGVSVSLKPITRIWMLKPTRFPLKNSLPLRIRSSIKNKVFEDQSEGVICYADENGEIICEGYDEGPRFHQNVSEKGNHQRETEIIDLLLKQSWIQLGKGGGGELSHAEKGVAVQKDLNINGFNSFC